MLEAYNVVINRGARRLLDDVTFAAASGRVTAVVGPNGAGKSTLLRVLAGELRPDNGVVALNGANIASVSAAWLARRRAVVPQASVLSFPFTALEVVLLGATVPGFASENGVAVKRGCEALDRLGLADFAARPYAQLSGGERQRVHIARAICQLEFAPSEPGEPHALLLDEPTSSQDLGHQRLVVDEIRRLADAGAAVMIVMHDLNLAAAAADQVALMRDGRVLANGPPSAVFTEMLLSDAFGCEVAVLRDAGAGPPIVLPMLRAQLQFKDEAAE